MTCDGEAHWYLALRYTREASGADSASQELYINKILKRWGMDSYKPLPSPFPAKSAVVHDELLKPIENPDLALNKNNFRKSSVNFCIVNSIPFLKTAGQCLS